MTRLALERMKILEYDQRKHRPERCFPHSRTSCSTLEPHSNSLEPKSMLGSSNITKYASDSHDPARECHKKCMILLQCRKGLETVLSIAKHSVLRWASTEKCSPVKSFNTKNVHVEGLQRRRTMAFTVLRCPVI
jgi:hypothetical protein